MSYSSKTAIIACKFPTAVWPLELQIVGKSDF